MRSLLPKMIALGVLQAEAIDLDKLEEKLRLETLTTKRPCVSRTIGMCIRPYSGGLGEVCPPHPPDPTQILPQGSPFRPHELQKDFSSD